MIAVFQDAYAVVLAEEKLSHALTHTTLERVLIELRCLPQVID